MRLRPPGPHQEARDLEVLGAVHIVPVLELPLRPEDHLLDVVRVVRPERAELLDPLLRLTDQPREALPARLPCPPSHFQRRRREFQEDLNARKNEELQQVYERANRVVKQVAEAEKYDAILQEAIYINPKHDITEKVIKALNASTSNGGK